MSIRVILCFLFVIGFSIYAYRNWFVSLCASILLMAVVQHPDLPRSIAGIQGLNPWNLLFLNVVLAWLRGRPTERLRWDLPAVVVVFLCLYGISVLIAAFRLLGTDHDAFGFTTGYIVSEFIINCLKWVIPGLMLFDSCRSPSRIVIAAGCVLGLFFLLAVQVIKNVPLSAATSGEMDRYAAKNVQKNVGYNRVTLSMMLGGASWGMLCMLPLCQKPSHKTGLLTAAGVIALGQALTGGRTGYVAWGIVGVFLGVVRWRRFLPVIPAAVACVSILLPGVRERMLRGFGSSDGNIIVRTDDYEVTSGRSIAWPYVIKGIAESPLIGYGRQAMITTGIARQIEDDYGEGEDFPHPHNAYLEVLLDGGVFQLLCILPFYLIAFWRGLILLRSQEDALACAVGGMACSLIVALLVGSMGGQTFYPREGAVGLWAALGIMFRVSVEQSRSRELGAPLFGEETESEFASATDAVSEGQFAARMTH